MLWYIMWRCGDRVPAGPLGVCWAFRAPAAYSALVVLDLFDREEEEEEEMEREGRKEGKEERQACQCGLHAWPAGVLSPNRHVAAWLRRAQDVCS